MKDLSKNNKSYYSIVIMCIIGVIPLAYLGLITPSQEVAFLIGISDIMFAGIFGLSAYLLGKDSKNNE